MRVAHIVFGMTTGGIETMLTNIASEQAISGHEIGIFIINDLIDATLLNSINKKVYIIRINRPLGSINPWYIIKLNLSLIQFKPDKIHIHKAKIINYLLPKLKRRICVTQHDILESDDMIPLKQIHQIFAISNAVKQNIKEQTGKDSTVVYNGIHTSIFRQRKEIHRHSESLSCVCVGRLMHNKKGQDILIKALSLLPDNMRQNIHVDFIGEGNSLKYLQSLTDSYNLNDIIEFKGFKSQQWLQDNLCHYDVFIAPSLYEGFGLTIVEAMCAGIPVLVSNIQGPLEIIDNGHYGISFENGNAADCASKLTDIIKSKDLSEIASQAYAHAKEHFDVSVTAKKYLELYNEK